MGSLDTPTPIGQSAQSAQGQLEQQLADLKTKLESDDALNKQSLAALEEKLKLKDEFAKLREEVNGKFLFFQWSAAAITVIAGLLAGFGLKSVSDYAKTIKTEVSSRLDTIESYYYEFSRGVALTDTGEAKEALPHFRFCFSQEAGRYDEGLLIPFLKAIDEADDWEEATDVIGTLKSDQKKYDAIKSPWVWGNLASLEIQIGVKNPESLQEGRMSLGKFEALADPSDPEMLRARFFLHWMLSLCDNKVSEAKEYVSKIGSLPKSVKIDSWDKTKTWRFTKEILNRKVATEQQLKEMIMPLKDHFRADQ
jgi:hypothetical protein